MYYTQMFHVINAYYCIMIPTTQNYFSKLFQTICWSMKSCYLTFELVWSFERNPKNKFGLSNKFRNKCKSTLKQEIVMVQLRLNVVGNSCLRCMSRVYLSTLLKFSVTACVRCCRNISTKLPSENFH